MNSKRRLTILAGLSAIVFILLAGRLVYVMAISRDEIYEKAMGQIVREVTVPAARGDLLDRNGSVIAASADAYRLDIDLKTFRRTLETKERTAEYYAVPLASVLGEPVEDILAIMNKTSSSSLVKRKMEKSQADAVRAWMNEAGTNFLILGYDSIRYYPNGPFLAHVIGTVGNDGEGTMGIEYLYNDLLRGVDGIKISEIDGKKQDLPYTEVVATPAVDGSDLVLTIDEKIQYAVENIAAETMESTEAKAVTIIVSDPKTGEILGMANLPEFDPTDPALGLSSEQFNSVTRNRAVNDTYEPGSTLKMITMAAALSEGKVSLSDTFFCKGYTYVNGVKIRCAKHEGHGLQTLEEVFQNSCNPGVIEIAQRVGIETLNEYIAKFHLGEKTGIDLPGEAKGIIKKTDDVTPLDLATISIGQTDTATPIQILGTLNTIANGGYYTTLHLVRETVPKNGAGERLDPVPYIEKRGEMVIEKDVNDELLKMLELVVEKGSGKNARIEGVRVIGKTGTAEKLDPATGKYSEEDFIASFVGAAPADDPRISVYVAVDSPKDVVTGGAVAAPVAKKVFLEIMKHMDLSSESN